MSNCSGENRLDTSNRCQRPIEGRRTVARRPQWRSGARTSNDACARTPQVLQTLAAFPPRPICLERQQWTFRRESGPIVHITISR
jgi:hypothetical protein